MDDYTWETENEHCNNTETMRDYLDNHLPEAFEVKLWEDTYSEIENRFTGERFEVHAAGNGDFTHHIVTFIKL